jgi:hypothetical protein
MSIVQVEHDPQASADHHQNQEPGKKQCHEIFARSPPEVDVEEVTKLDDDLDDRRDRNDGDRRGRRQQTPIHDRKREHRQGERKSEADQIAAPIDGWDEGFVAHRDNTPGR